MKLWLTMSKKKSFPLRIDQSLYDVLERWATDEFRSVNSQIEYIIRNAAQKSGRLPAKYWPEGDEVQNKK